MSVNDHSDAKVWGLRVTQCHGSMPAEKRADPLKIRLAEFDLDLSRRVTCVTTDGALFI